jgi:hypothetical protein
MSNAETGRERIVVRVGEKEIEINEDVLHVLHEYVHTPMPLEKLAERLGLEGWEEAYEFVKKVPAWVLWTPSSMWKIKRAAG